MKRTNNPLAVFFFLSKSGSQSLTVRDLPHARRKGGSQNQVVGTFVSSFSFLFLGAPSKYLHTYKGQKWGTCGSAQVVVTSAEYG